ncbi:unnamed protein product [Leuciscus chuanchicus]
MASGRWIHSVVQRRLLALYGSSCSLSMQEPIAGKTENAVSSKRFDAVEKGGGLVKLSSNGLEMLGKRSCASDATACSLVSQRKQNYDQLACKSLPRSDAALQKKAEGRQ